MKQSKFENYSLWLVILWFIVIGALAFMFTGCAVKDSDYVHIKSRVHVDSVEEIRPVSTLEFEPKYRMHLSNGRSVIVRNRQYAYNTDSVELVFIKKIK
jgi:hypothetical protein